MQNGFGKQPSSKIAPVPHDNAADPFGFAMRALPASVQAEMAVLGALLANNKAAEFCRDLREEHFHDPINGRIFAAAMRRIDAGLRTDTVLLKADFENSGILDAVGGTAYLASLLTAMVSLQIGGYADLIKTTWVRRQIIERCQQAIDTAYGIGPDTPDALAQVGRAADDILALAEAGGEGVMTLDQAMQAAIDDMERVRAANGLPGISTGFRCLDERWGGLEPGCQYIVAARPGLGKSSLVHQIAVHVARMGGGVYEASQEMTGRSLGKRTLAAAAGVSLMAIQRGRTTVGETDRIVGAQRELNGLPLTIDERPSRTVADILAGARLAKRAHGLHLVLVDHLHIMGQGDVSRDANETSIVGRNSTALKQAAKLLGCPILVAAQLNRGPENREDKRPNKGDLRQSGNIEQDADCITFIYREGYYLGDTPPEAKVSETPAALDKRRSEWSEARQRCGDNAELITDKVRDGVPGTDVIQWEGRTTSFREEF
jgi:replicative DNA helicase